MEEQKEQTVYHIMVDEIVTCTYSVPADSPKEAVEKLLNGDIQVYLEGEECQGYVDPVPFCVYECYNYDHADMRYFDSDANEHYEV